MDVAWVIDALAQLTAATFAGACLYIAVAQQPVRAALAPDAALEDFRSVIPRAEKIQAPLLVVALLSAAVSATMAPSWPVLVGGLLLLATLVLTVAAVLPINRRLLRGRAEDQLTASPAAIARWGRLHAWRTALAVIGAVLLVFRT